MCKMKIKLPPYQRKPANTHGIQRKRQEMGCSESWYFHQKREGCFCKKVVSTHARRQHKLRKASHDPSHSANARALEERFRELSSDTFNMQNYCMKLYYLEVFPDLKTFHPCVKVFMSGLTNIHMRLIGMKKVSRIQMS